MIRKIYLGEDNMNCHWRCLENLKCLWKEKGKEAQRSTSHPVNANFSPFGFQLDLKTSCIKIMTHHFMDYGIKWATELPDGALQVLRGPLWKETCRLLSVVERKILRTVELEDLILTRLWEVISIFGFYRFTFKILMCLFLPSIYPSFM